MLLIKSTAAAIIIKCHMMLPDNQNCLNFIYSYETYQQEKIVVN